MATNQVIKLKRGTSTPTTSNIASGEVAVDTSAQKLFINDSGTIKELGTSGALLSSSTVAIKEFEYTASGSQTTFSGNDTGSQSLIYTAGSIMVFLNGILQDDSVDYTATNGTSVVFTTALAANDEVRILTFGSTVDSVTPTKLDAISTVNNQAAYSMTVGSSAYTPSHQNALIVSVNGITQEPGDSFTISGSTITFAPALVTGDVIDYIIDLGRKLTVNSVLDDATALAIA